MMMSFIGGCGGTMTRKSMMAILLLTHFIVAAVQAQSPFPSPPPPLLPHQIQQQQRRHDHNADSSTTHIRTASGSNGNGQNPRRTIEAVHSMSTIRLPPHYTAMERDIEVSFTLDRPNAFEYNAIVHLEYLPGDAILPGEEHQSDSKKLTSLPVPLGLQKGTVVFQCGAIKYAGPHRAYLTVNGKRIAESAILQVAWPPMSITAPSRLETYSTDVSVTVAFTRSLCTTFTTYGDFGTQGSPFYGRKRKSKLGFETTLDLIECSKSVVDPDKQSCQAPTSPDDPRVWLRIPLDNLYRKPSLTVAFNCTVWGGVGTFRLFLRTNLSHVGVVSRSAAIAVHGNPEYGLRSRESEYVFPCLRNDIKLFEVQRPGCAPRRDKVRVYGQGYQVVGDGNLIPSQWDYLGEKGLEATEDVVFVPCEYFKERYWKFCFHYVSTSMVGSTNTLAKICLPAKDSTEAIPVSTWGPWSSWTSCSRTCGRRGVITRHRICQLPQNTKKRILCEGPRVEEKPCPLSNPCPVNDESHHPEQKPFVFDNRDPNIWTPLFEDESISPCSCGCIYIVGGSRRIGITSAQDCTTAPFPLRWKVKVSENDTMNINVSFLQHSCLDGMVYIRDGDDPINGRLLDKIGFFHTDESSQKRLVTDGSDSSSGLVTANHILTNEVIKTRPRGDLKKANTVTSFNTTKPVVTFELRSKHRDCRVNMELNVVARSVSTKPESVLHSMFTWTKGFSRHVPAVVLVLVSALLVSVACCLFLICQFEYHKKKYVSWKSAHTSGYSTPTHAHALTQRVEDTAGEPLLAEMVAAGATYIPMEDIETAVSSMEALDCPSAEERRMRREGMRNRLKLRLRLESKHATVRPLSHYSALRRRSLPSSPFLTRRHSHFPSSSTDASSSSSRMITADQVKKALALKSLRYQRGHFQPIGRPVVPLPSPQDDLLLQSRLHSHSRSLSDVLNLLSHEEKTSGITTDEEQRRRKRELRRRHQQQGQHRQQRRQQTASSLLRQQHAGNRVMKNQPSISSLSSRGADAASTTSSRPPSGAHQRRRLTHDSVQRLSRNSISVLSRTESQDTLKNRSASRSSFSGRSSVMSGDQELEFDLYDYNLDNVVAYNPGSMFAPQFWPLPDATPTNEDEFQMRELFPKEEDEEDGVRGATSSSGTEANFSSPERKEEEDAMLRSRTSDLTASVTSADLRNSSGSNNNYDTDEEGGAGETDALLGSSRLTLVAKAPPPALMNLTHIDDEISFADDDNHAAVNVNTAQQRKETAASARRRFMSTQC